jgi:hypothetical protein
MLTHVESALSFSLQRICDVFLDFRLGDLVVLHGHLLVKTLSFLLLIRCQLSKEGSGVGSSAIYVDGGNTFDPYTFSAIAKKYDADPKRVLERIFVSRAFTAYQLSALVFETLDDALKQYRSKVVLVSDATSLFLDNDVPTKESIGIFNKAVAHLSDLTLKRSVIVIITSFLQQRSRRRVFLESILFGRAGTIIRVTESRDKLRFILEKHPSLEPFTLDVPQNVITLEGLVEL